MSNVVRFDRSRRRPPPAGGPADIPSLGGPLSESVRLDGSLSLDSGILILRGQLDDLSVLLVDLERCLDELSDCIEDCGGDPDRTLSKLATLKANAERAWQQLNELDSVLVLDDLPEAPS